jgi:hypothetical protein
MLALLTILGLLGDPTEYERVVSLLSPELFVGGCHDPGENPDSPSQAAIRSYLTSNYSWSIVTSDALDRMTEFADGRGIVDFGAGNGYVSYLLADRDLDVIAIDNWAGGKPDKLWFPVHTGSFELLADTKDDVLLLSWPPKETAMATKALQAWDGDRLIYAGEILRGTADPAFHRELAANWRLVERVTVPQWRNRSDAIFLFERSPGNGVGDAWMKAELAKCTFGENP